MLSNTTSSRQLGPHSIQTWAGYRHWQNKNAWMANVERTPPEGGCLVRGKRRSIRGEPRSPRVQCRRALSRGPTWRASLGGATVLCGGGGVARGPRVRQVAPQPRAASRSAATFPFARGVSAFVWDGVQEIDTSSFLGRGYEQSSAC